MWFRAVGCLNPSAKRPTVAWPWPWRCRTGPGGARCRAASRSSGARGGAGRRGRGQPLAGPWARDTARAMSQENVELVTSIYAEGREYTAFVDSEATEGELAEWRP